MTASTRRVGDPLSRWLPVGGIALAAVVAFLRAERGSMPSWFFDVLPVDVGGLDPAAAAATALVLAMLCVALMRRKSIAWWLASAMLLAGIGWAASNGDDASATVAAVCLLLLALRRPLYRVRGPRTAGVVVVASFVVGIVVAIAFSVGAAAGAGLLLPADLVAGWIASGADGRLAGAAGGAGVAAWILVALRVAAGLGMLLVLRPATEPGSERALDADGRALAGRIGAGALLPFQLDPDKRWLAVGGDAVVAYGRAGRTALALGDPIAVANARPRAVVGFAAACAERDWVPAVYQVSSETRDALVASGWRAIPIGREAVLRPASFSLDGSARANLRHTVHRAERAGLSFTWYPAGVQASAGALREELVAIDRAWRHAAGPPLGFSIHRFDERELDRLMVAVAMRGERAVAFTTFRATGADGGAVLDLIRRRRDAPPGAVDGCLVAAAEGLAASGASELSLGLAPLHGLDRRSSDLAERWLARLIPVISRFYDVDGLAFFKRKFDPVWRTRWLVVPTWRALPGALIALAWLHIRPSSGPPGA